ncbi:DUF6270 domain-containing protein [Pseudochelatococcus lubricantis]|uniref:DUF6270 domain-containing protein n=1 Tax=Pseudochelatococcus lubricantis TaxID=1538102 RepID=UPI0035E8BD37
MTSVLYVGGCNAENVANRLPGVTRLQKIYRLPTACMANEVLPESELDFFRQDPRIWQRASYEAEKRFLEPLTGSRFDIIIVDFWRDSYIELIDVNGTLLSYGWEIIENIDFQTLIKKKYRIITIGSSEYQAAFQAGICALYKLIEVYQPNTRMIFLDCPPVSRSKHNREIIQLSARFGYEKWKESYLTYKSVLSSYVTHFPRSSIFAFSDEAWTSPDAPWGEGAIHYAPAFYEEMARLINIE